MNITELKKYQSIRLLNIECDVPFDWEENQSTHIRVCLPANLENEKLVTQRGYFLADRLLDVSINLKKLNIDFDSLVRIKPSLTTNNRENILRIALNSFPTDRRFHVGIEYNNDIAGQVISGWIESLTEWYICEYKEQTIGFLALKEINGVAFIHLAAVEEKYRLTGAALSLYAYAASLCKNNGFVTLNGRISTLNMPVINLYSFLGAVFSNPKDIFLKEVM
jgi:hypothetical protein